MSDKPRVFTLHLSDNYFVEAEVCESQNMHIVISKSAFDEVVAERDRLREALEEINLLGSCSNCEYCANCGSGVYEAQKIARLALEGK